MNIIVFYRITPYVVKTFYFLTTFSYREAGGLTHMCPAPSTIFKKNFFILQKIYKKNFLNKKIKKF